MMLKLFAGCALHTVALIFVGDFLITYNIPILQFLCLFTFGTAITFLVFQNSSKTVPLSRHQIFVIASNGLLLSIQLASLFFGVKYCGALRATLVLSSPFFLLPWFSAPSVTSPFPWESYHVRRAQILSFGAFLLLFVVSDSSSETSTRFGISLVFFAAALESFRQFYTRRLYKEFVGPKRLHALSCAIAACIFLCVMVASNQSVSVFPPISNPPESVSPLSFLKVAASSAPSASSASSASSAPVVSIAEGSGAQRVETKVIEIPFGGPSAWLWILVLGAAVAVLGVAPLSLEALSVRLDRPVSLRVRFFAPLMAIFFVFISTLLGVIPTCSIFIGGSLSGIAATCGCVFFMTMAFFDASHALSLVVPSLPLQRPFSSENPVMLPTLVAQPLFSSTLSSPAFGVCAHTHQFFVSAWEERNSRHMLIFLSLNFAFMFVEFFYGVATNSLSLISDSGHMLLDCMGLVIGLAAAHMSRLKPTAQFTLGFGRFEVLSGFVNGLFLLYVAYFVCVEALERLVHPPDVHGEQLVVVAVCGLIINLIGLSLFHQHHTHGVSLPHRAPCEHHHEDHEEHGHHSHSHAAAHAHSHNLYAMYMHVLSDALGSLGVIISSLLIQYGGWMILDPICSLCISALILVSVWPLVWSSALVLLNATPSDLETDIKRALYKVSFVDGVIGYRDPHFWLQSSGFLVGSLHVQVRSDVDTQRVLHQVSALLTDAQSLGAHQLTVQTETEMLLQTLDPSGTLGIAASYYHRDASFHTDPFAAPPPPPWQPITPRILPRVLPLPVTLTNGDISDNSSNEEVVSSDVVVALDFNSSANDQSFTLPPLKSVSEPPLLSPLAPSNSIEGFPAFLSSIDSEGRCFFSANPSQSPASIAPQLPPKPQRLTAHYSAPSPSGHLVPHVMVRPRPPAPAIYKKK